MLSPHTPEFLLIRGLLFSVQSCIRLFVTTACENGTADAPSQHATISAVCCHQQTGLLMRWAGHAAHIQGIYTYTEMYTGF